MNTKPVRILLALVALAVLAGCGSGSTATSGAVAAEVPEIVPASVPLLVAVDTNRDSEQWQRADALLDRFPARDRLFESLREELAGEGLSFEEDVLPALGDATFLAFLDFENEGDNVVVITKPRDPAKFRELVRRGEETAVTRELDGWTVAAESDAVLDRLAAAGGEPLRDAQWFRDAAGRAGDDALVSLFVNGGTVSEALREELPEGCELPQAFAALEYAAGVVVAEDDGVRFRLVAAGDGIGELARGESLFRYVPADVFAYLGSPGFDTSRFSLGEQVRCAAGADAPDAGELGSTLDELTELFSGGLALYGRSAPIIPEVTLLLAPEDETKALATLDRLVDQFRGFGGLEVERRRVGDVDARAIELGPVTLLYGVSDGKLVVTLSPEAFEHLSGGGDSLADDPAFQGARQAAGVGENDEVFVYLDLQALVRIADGLAGFAGEGLPPNVAANLEPLDTFIAWGDLEDPDEVEVGAFLALR